MALPFDVSKAKSLAQDRLTFNADTVAIALALTFAALIRFNVIQHIGW